MLPSASPTPASGTLHRHDDVPTREVEPRTVDVWLPPAYDHSPDRSFPVLYMHDGQNLFDPTLSFTGTAWGVDKALNRLIASGEILPAIVVGVWNTALRIPEYMPQKPLAAAPARMRRRFLENFGAAPCSDAYLRFLVEELKPFIDARYRTRRDAASTAICGSSMGGLISLYAFCEYPDVFSRAACLSTSWTVAGRVLLPYLAHHIPPPTNHRIYFDYGVEAQIATYELHQRRIDRLFRRAGYTRGLSWTTRHFRDAEHSESAWADRIDIPLKFLLRPQPVRRRVHMW